jgi:hypothetical protein
MRVWRSLLVIAVLTTTGHAFDEPTDFRGLKFGEDIETQIPKCPYNSVLNKTPAHKEMCWTKFREFYHIDNFAPVAGVTLNPLAGQNDSKLGMLILSFPATSYSTITAVFKERYGAPTAVTESTWVSKGGVRLPNIKSAWNGENIHIELTHRGTNRDRSEIIISNKQWRDAALSEKRGTIKDAAKDL